VSVPPAGCRPSCSRGADRPDLSHPAGVHPGARHGRGSAAWLLLPLPCNGPSHSLTSGRRE